MSRRLMTLTKAAEEIGVSYRTFYNYAKRGWFAVYKLPGETQACVELNEVRVALAAKKSQARTNYGSFGPDAVVKDLTNVAQAFEVEH